jgi:hypothetical protein
VNELLDNGMKGWDQDKLETIFSAEEIAAITSIPISLTDQPDT